MWKDQDGNEIGSGEQYRAPGGTLYPADFPKAEVPGLAWVEDAPAVDYPPGQNPNQEVN